MATAVAASNSVAPGHLSAGTMVAAVLSYLQLAQDDEHEGLALQALNSAAARVNARKWNKLVGSSELTMTAADDDIGLPSDFKEPLACYTLNSSDERKVRLDYLPLQSLLAERQDNSTPSTPGRYSIDYKARELILEVQPSSAWVSNVPKLRIYYHRRLPKLTDASTTITCEPELEWYLIWYARAEMASIVDPTKFGLARSQSDDMWRELKRGDTDQMTDWGWGNT